MVRTPAPTHAGRAAPLPSITVSSRGGGGAATDGDGSWHVARASWYGTPKPFVDVFAPSRGGGESAFGILEWGGCGYTNSNGYIPFPKEAVSSYADQNPDFPGSCGRCYEIKWVTQIGEQMRMAAGPAVPVLQGSAWCQGCRHHQPCLVHAWCLRMVLLRRAWQHKCIIPYDFASPVGAAVVTCPPAAAAATKPAGQHTSSPTLPPCIDALRRRCKEGLVLGWRDRPVDYSRSFYYFPEHGNTVDTLNRSFPGNPAEPQKNVYVKVLGRGGGGGGGGGGGTACVGAAGEGYVCL